MKILEFRSDTFTQPTPAMRKAMAEAEVGDDQYGEDPTVNKLEERAASIVGKEAGVYVASGMLGNLCGVLSQTNRGDEIILGDMAHIYQNEMGASMAAPCRTATACHRSRTSRRPFVRCRGTCPAPRSSASRTRTTTAVERSSRPPRPAPRRRSRTIAE